MKLIDENYQGFDIEDNDLKLRHVFEYDVKEADFFLSLHHYWYTFEELVHWYTLDIGGHIVRLPSVMYIMLADVYSQDIDWIRVDELPGRTLTTALYYSHLPADQWSVEEINVIDADSEAKPLTLPHSKNLMPVLAGTNRMIFVAEKDCYVKTKRMNFACLY